MRNNNFKYFELNLKHQGIFILNPLSLGINLIWGRDYYEKGSAISLFELGHHDALKINFNIIDLFEYEYHNDDLVEKLKRINEESFLNIISVNIEKALSKKDIKVSLNKLLKKSVLEYIEGLENTTDKEFYF